MTKPSRPASKGRDAGRGIVVAGRERLHGGESGDTHPGNRRFRAATDDGVQPGRPGSRSSPSPIA